MRKLLALTTAAVILAVMVLANSKPAQVILRDNYEHTWGWALPTASGWHLRGIATWYNAKLNNAWYTRANKWGKAIKFYVAAGPALRDVVRQRYMMKPFPIWITSRLTGKVVKAWVVDWCGCHGYKKDPNDTRLADFSPAIWEALGVRLGRGVMPVEITLDKP